ncbi:MAG: glycosyltransferase, partial [Candidatus Nealsonbacteria bacterium]|nr:glycosyltransferase [Candidatus Nealsonbacteria bacterium]
MKNVLFIGVTKYDLDKDIHLRKKFEGLAQGIEPYVLARGKTTLGRKIFGAKFYLLPRSIFFWPIALKLSFWLCLIKKIDVIVAQSPLMEGFVGVILKKILGKELIIEMHGDWEVKKSIAFLAPFSLRNADKIRGVAQYLVDKAKKIAPDKPYFIFPTFTDLDDFLKEKDTRFDNFILFVGRDNPVKGVKYLIEAFSMIRNDFPDFKLVLVGEGLAEGKLPLEEVRKRMKDCYCLAVSSLSEGLPRVIIEAQALAKPVIASKVGGIPDLVKDGQTGFLFEVGNVEQLA